ncbi:MAG: Uma2 family endonuclease [Candidatus Acetothermia bacterium]|jgi:Uma2 family endonuclease|nr:Uma2 family endonuclease [Candidatus Acetothermia bacterium]MDH7505984.1 Uma2 family endonuclease [Candidatus Acetothermia bacterium]
MGKLEAPARKLTYEEFLEWCDEDTWAEWVDGEVIVLTPASRRHQELADFLIQTVGIFVKVRDLGVMLSAPFQMKTGPDLPGREPDILFVAKENLEQLKQTYLDGPAALVIEIVSPQSRLRDRGEKFAEYELGGVKEYWLIDPDRKEADFYLLDERGRFRLREADPEGVYRSEVLPGFWLRVAWLFQEPLPPILEVLKQLGLV